MFVVKSYRGVIAVEFVVGAALIVLLLFLLGLGAGEMVFLLIAALGVFICAVAGFFLWCAARLAFSRRREGVFCGTEKSGRFERAVYMVEGEKHPCVFPSEKLLQSRLYKADKPVSVWVLPNGKLFDASALATVIAGTAFFVPSAALWALRLLTM